MSSLFKTAGGTTAKGRDWAREAERRSAPVVDRLQAGLFLRYRAATGARETDSFQRDAKTWAFFEHAVLPELEKFTFFDKERETFVDPGAALGEGMFHLWTVTDLGLDQEGPPNTLNAIEELAHFLCAVYQTKPIDDRQRRNWFGLGAKR